MPIIAKAFGAIGLLLITSGVVNKNNLQRNQLFVAGGLFLLFYSSYLQDPVFIPLQIIFTIASIYEIIKLKKIRS